MTNTLCHVTLANNSAMIEDHFGMHLVLIPHCMTKILAKECKSGKSTVLALGTMGTRLIASSTHFLALIHVAYCCGSGTGNTAMLGPLYLV